MGPVVAELGDGELADASGIPLEADLLVEQARVAVGAPDVVQRDPPPLLGEAQDLVVLGGLAEGGVGIADMT